MKYAKLGNTGLVVSRLAFGAMNFGSGQYYGFRYKVDQDGANAMVGKALDAGVNLFDTANMYAGGQSEEMLGRALGKRRQDVTLATKGGIRMSDRLLDFGLSRRNLTAAARASLDRLGTDHIDLYQIHTPDPLTPIEETVRALDELVRSGTAGYVGFSNLPAWQAAKGLTLQRERDYAPFVSAQMHYSLLGRDVENEVVPFLQDAGLGLLVWSPLAGGFLTGKYTPEDPQGSGGRLSTFNFLPINRELGYETVDHLRTVAKVQGATVPQVALAWLLAKPFVTSVIVGATSMRQLEENLGATDVNLTQAQMEELDKLTAPPTPYPSSFVSADPMAEGALHPEGAEGKRGLQGM